MTSLNSSEIANMRADLETVQLSMTCVIERNVSTGVDPDNHPIGSWTTFYSGKCWYWEILRRILIEETEGPFINAADGYPHLLLPANVDITTWDRVASVTDFAGNVIATNLNVKSVLHRMLDTLVIVESQR